MVLNTGKSFTLSRQVVFSAASMKGPKVDDEVQETADSDMCLVKFPFCVPVVGWLGEVQAAS